MGTGNQGTGEQGSGGAGDVNDFCQSGLSRNDPIEGAQGCAEG